MIPFNRREILGIGCNQMHYNDRISSDYYDRIMMLRIQ